MSHFFRFSSGRVVSRISIMLLAAAVLVPTGGCLSIGGRTELVGVTDDGRMKSLETRVEAIERSLGITPPPPIIGSKPTTTTTTTSKTDDRKPATNATAATASPPDDNIQNTSFYVGLGR